MKVLLLASYCGEENGCTNAMPCDECLTACNVVEIPDDTFIMNNYGGLNYLREKRRVKNMKLRPFLQRAVLLINRHERILPERFGERMWPHLNDTFATNAAKAYLSKMANWRLVMKENAGIINYKEPHKVEYSYHLSVLGDYLLQLIRERETNSD